MMPTWIPLMDYAIKRGVSLSTLRRHIKANKIPYQIENGRYLLQLEDNTPLDGAMTLNAHLANASPAPAPRPLQVSALSSAPVGSTRDDGAALQAKLRKLELDLLRAREEIAELKTLIALYEENMPPHRLNN